MLRSSSFALTCTPLSKSTLRPLILKSRQVSVCSAVLPTEPSTCPDFVMVVNQTLVKYPLCGYASLSLVSKMSLKSLR